MPRRPTTSARRAGHVIVGLGALAFLITLVVGVPLLLARLGGDPLPQRMPGLDDIWQALISRDNGALFLRTLDVVAWAAWATFTLSVLVEIPAAVRRRPPIRLPLLGWQQQAAATLIASIGLMFPASTVASAAATPPAAVTVSTTATNTLRTSPAAFLTGVTWQPISSPANPGATVGVYVVAHGDRLTAIAERFTGNPDAYVQIAALNGLHNPDVIHTGQQLQLPAGAVDHGAHPHAHGTVLTITPVPAPAGPTAPATGGNTATPGPSPTRPSTSAPTPAPSTSSPADPSAPAAAGASAGAEHHDTGGNHSDEVLSVGARSPTVTAKRPWRARRATASTGQPRRAADRGSTGAVTSRVYGAGHGYNHRWLADDRGRSSWSRGPEQEHAPRWVPPDETWLLVVGAEAWAWASTC